MKIGTKAMLFLVVGFLFSGSLFAFAPQDQLDFVVHISRCLPKGVKIFSAHDLTPHGVTTGECFRVLVYMEEARKPKPPRRFTMWSGPPVGVWVYFLSEQYRPGIFERMNQMTQIPVADCSQFNVVVMSYEMSYSWFLDPIWQEFYERLQKEFAFVRVASVEGL